MNEKTRKLSLKYHDKPVLLTDAKSIYYLTGADFDGFWLFLYKDQIFIITSKMIEGQARQHFKNRAKIVVAPLSFSDCLVNTCKKNKINKIYIDTSGIDIHTFDIIQNKLDTNKIVVYKISSSTSDLRIIKNKSEIQNIKKACSIVSKVYEKIKKKIVPGITELDIYFKIEEEFAKSHVVPSFKTIVASGPNSANPHHRSGNRKILKNDIVLIDMGCTYNGYCSDLTRVVFLGKISSVSKEIWTVVKQAHDTSLLSVKIGNSCGNIDFVAREIITKAGFADNFIHTTGHGVGINIHESPSISQISKEVLQEGMVITIEPGIYIKNKFGIRIEDTILVTKNGCKVLTSAKY